MTNSGVTTESGGRQNMYPSETKPYIDETVSTMLPQSRKSKWSMGNDWLYCFNWRLRYNWSNYSRRILKLFLEIA